MGGFEGQEGRGKVRKQRGRGRERVRVVEDGMERAIRGEEVKGGVKRGTEQNSRVSAGFRQPN